MNWDDVKGLKYFIIYSILLVGFFVYSGLVGWLWFNPTQAEPTRGKTTGRSGHVYRYHK